MDKNNILPWFDVDPTIKAIFIEFNVYNINYRIIVK